MEPPKGYLEKLIRKRYSQNTIKTYLSYMRPFVEEFDGRNLECYHAGNKCILMTIYSGGLRRSELINLKVSDIDSQQMLIRISSSKGKKDLHTLLSQKLLLLLRDY